MRYYDTVTIGTIGNLVIDAKYEYRIEPSATERKVESIVLDIKRKLPVWGWETVKTIRLLDIPGWMWEMLTSPEALACLDIPPTSPHEPVLTEVDLRNLEERERRNDDRQD